MHKDMSSGPERPAPPDLADNPNLTIPDTSCLTPEERAAQAAAIVSMTTGLAEDSPTLFSMGREAVARMDAHNVGHLLNGMVWSGIHAAQHSSGMEVRDARDVVIALTRSENTTLAHERQTDLVNDFVRCTIAGASEQALDLWSAWVEELAPGDWEIYSDTVDWLIEIGFKFALSRLVEDEQMSEMLGHKALRLVAACGHDHAYQHSPDEHGKEG